MGTALEPVKLNGTALIGSFKRANQLLDPNNNIGAKIRLSLPAHMNGEHFLRMACFSMLQQPKLLDCTEASLVRAVERAAGLGLEIDGVTGHGYLIPYGNQAEFVPGYRGLIELTRRSGQIESFSAHVVRPGDDFDFEFGSNSFIKHRRLPKYERFDVWSWVYAIVKFTNGGSQFNLMSYEEVIYHRNKYSPGYNRKDSAWQTNEIAMAQKTVCRGLVKFLPVSPEILRMAMLDEYHEAGVLAQSDPGNYQRSRQSEAEFLDADYQTENPEPNVLVAEKQESPPPQDFTAEITKLFAQAAVKGAQEVERLYDQLAGPNSQYGADQLRVITETRDIVRRRMETKDGKSGGGSQQKTFT